MMEREMNDFNPSETKKKIKCDGRCVVKNQNAKILQGLYPTQEVSSEDESSNASETMVDYEVTTGPDKKTQTPND